MRFWIQAASTVLTNSYLKGFVTGKIYQGTLKHVCVPTLNCYSCPGALFACPIGAAQVVIASGGGLDPTAIHTYRERLTAIATSTPMFIIGFLAILAAFVGRASCGWVCPFGWLQGIMYKIPSRKFKAQIVLRWLKYIFLTVFVILMPLLWVDSFGMSDPAYCKYICPAGTLEGGIPLAILNPSLRGMLGKLFAWKIGLLIFFLAAMVFIRRPFCSWACPLGAFLAPFNRISFFRLKLDNDSCIDCGLCDTVCPSGLDVRREIDGLDCIRCLECKNVCPKSVITIEKPRLPWQSSHLNPQGTPAISNESELIK